MLRASSPSLSLSAPLLFARRSGLRGTSHRPTLSKKHDRFHDPGAAALAALLGANVGVFFLWKSAPKPFMVKNFTLQGGSLGTQRPHTFLTHMVSHQDFFHLLSNTITLYFFGSHVAGVKLAGRSVLAPLYLTAGLVAAAAQLSAMPHPSSFMLGSSGAVSGIVMTSIILQPRATVYLYGLLPVPAALFGLGFILYDTLAARSGDGIGHYAHLAGAFVGVVAGVAIRRGVRF